MPHAVYEFIAAGAGDEITLANNKAAFDRVKLRPRVLRDVAAIGRCSISEIDRSVIW